MGTVTNTIGTSARDYSTIALWEAALPANLVTDGNSYIGQCFNDSTFNLSTTQLALSGSTTDASHTILLTTGSGQGFRDNGSAASNALRYNASNGVAITGNIAYSASIQVSDNFVTFQNLQIINTTASGNNQALNCNGTNFEADNCIFQSTPGAASSPTLYCLGASATVSNCLVVSDGTASTVALAFDSTGSAVNCTVVRPTNRAANTSTGIKNNYGAITVQNCVAAGFGTAIAKSGNPMTGPGNAIDGATYPASGPTGQISLTIATEFVQPDNSGSAMDWRLNTTSVKCKDQGVNSGGTTTDIIGQAISNIIRDAGAWELQQVTSTTGGARFKQRFNRSPLAYPAGAVPGVDPSHPASNNCAFSAINLNGSFVNLAGGAGPIQGAVVGTPAQGIWGALGPSQNFQGATDQIQFLGMPTKTQTVMTAASIFVYTSNPGSQHQFVVSTDGGANGGLIIGVTNGNTNFGFFYGNAGSGIYNSTIPVVVGVPYFLAVSAASNTVGNIVVRRLDTGAIFSQTFAMTGAANGSDGNWSISGRQGAIGRQALGYIAAGMASFTGLTLAQLQNWAADPWSFWYPNPTIEYITTAAAAATTVQFGWEPQLPLLPHLFYERRGAIARGDDGSETTKINWFNGGWEIQPPPPPHQPREKRGAILPRDDGNELPKINWFNAGWETQPPPPPHTRVENRGAIMPRDDGNQLPKINWFNGGWEVQPPPPATANRRNARAAILRGDDGTEGVFSAVVILTSSWGFDPNLPLVLRPKRLDAALIGEPGIQSPFILFRPSGFEIAPFQPPHPRSERSGSLMRGDDGAQAGKINFFPTGFEAVLHQPNHPRPERSGAMALGDIGYYAPTVTVVTSNWGFDAQSWQPPRQIYRAATLPWGDDGTQSPFILFRPTGFEISPVQPPHPRFEQRAAGFLRGDDGNQDILRSWFNAGWEVAPYQPQHVAYAKAGAIMFGDTGTESVYVFIAPAVGTSTWRTLMGVGI